MFIRLWNYLRNYGSSSTNEGLQDIESKLKEYAARLGLQQYYKKKLSKKTITTIGLENGVLENDKVWNFLQKLLLGNSNCKKELATRSPKPSFGRLEKELNISEFGSYADILIMLFFCSDDFLRRFLAEKLQLCQLAIPFILPMTEEVMIWPMRMVKTWKDVKSMSHEENLASYPMPFVLVVEIEGSENWSSSKLLNRVLSSDDSTYRGFSEPGLLENDLRQGYVELSWYLPGATAKHFPDAIGFFNLLGNLSTSLPLLECLAKVCSLMVVVSDCAENHSSLLSRLAQDKMIVVTGVKERAIKSKNLHYEVIAARDTEEAADVLRPVIQEKFFQMDKLCLESISDIFVSAGFDVDEQEGVCREAKEKMQTVLCGVHGEDIAEFKRNTLSLQMNWRKWSDLEKEQSRLRQHKPAEMSVENYVADLEAQKKDLVKELKRRGLSDGCRRFLYHMKQLSIYKRVYFLEWMKHELDALSRKELGTLHAEYTKSLGTETGDLERIDARISESSLGLEHYFREIGVSVELGLHDEEESRALARIVAELLLEGFPLEIIDGDALCIPVKWISKVLESVNNMENKACRVFSLSILGVQSSGKTTFLNTAFFINFAVSSGRCTRGAYMQLLKVKGRLSEEANVDFIAVIDTEGLKSSETASINTERDNELGTIAVGAADMSLINIAMEDIEGIKDVLQIIVYSLLRMSKVKEKPLCLFIHQNISDLKAEQVTLRERKRFLKGMDEMTKLAARMEHVEANYSKLADVMEFDDDKLSVYIPSLWKGTPPMSAISVAYSDAAMKTKMTVLEKMKRRTNQSLSVFAENVNVLWSAVKKESFLFSFENVALLNAYEQLSSFYVQRKWKAKTDIISWTKQMELVLNSCEERNLVECERKVAKDLEEKVKLTHEELKGKLKEYFSENGKASLLLERFRGNYEHDVEATIDLLRMSAKKEISTILVQKRASLNLKKVERKGELLISTRVKDLQDKYSTCTTSMTVNQMAAVKEEFSHLWTSVVEGIEYDELNSSVDVEAVMLSCLKEYMKMNKAYADVSEGFQGIRKKYENYQVSREDLNSSSKEDLAEVINTAQAVSQELLEEAVSEISNSTRKLRAFTEQECFDIIETSERNVKVSKSNLFQFTSHFHAKFIKEVCSLAVPKLQEMHDLYTEKENPATKLKSLKETYLDILVSAVSEKNNVKVFTNDLKQAIVSPRDFLFEKVSSLLEEEKSELCNRNYIQLHVLLDLKKTDDFKMYLRYIKSFKSACLSWMKAQIIEFLQEGQGREQRLIKIGLILAEEIRVKIQNCLECVAKESTNYSQFLDALHLNLMKNGVIKSSQYLQRLKMLKVKYLPAFVSKLLKEVSVDIMDSLIKDVMSWVVEIEVDQIQPPLEEQLFEVVMCKDGAQCPFCGVPCDKSGPHSQHESGLHRPIGLNRYRWAGFQSLVMDICTTLVASDCHFSNADTDYNWISYKCYNTIYPEWIIKATPSPHSGLYWKWVFATYHKEFAQEYKARQGSDMPVTWEKLDWPEVKEDLEAIYETMVVDKYQRCVPKPE